MLTDKELEEKAENYALKNREIIGRREIFTIDVHLGNPQQYEPVYANNKNVYDAVVYGYSLAKADIEKLNEQVKLLQEAVEFYADGEGEVLNWDGVNNYAYMQVKGKRAKEALQKLQKMRGKK